MKNIYTFVLEYYEIMILQGAEIIHHRGVVERIDDNKCYVRILQHSACSGCSAHKLCNSSESKEKIVEAMLSGAELQVGDSVDVEGSVRQGLHAVYLCYLIPLIFIVFFLFVGESLGGDLVAVSLSFLFLAVYYTVLYVFRRNIGKHFCFTVHKI